MDKAAAFAGVFLALMLGVMAIMGLNRLWRLALARLGVKAWLRCPRCLESRALAENEPLAGDKVCPHCGHAYVIES